MDNYCKIAISNEEKKIAIFMNELTNEQKK